MGNIKVSVIVPVYNVEDYLPRCLDSLVNQTLQEIEIIVVNDGSPDNSQAIIDDYAERYPEKIRPFIKENGGLSDARNFGVQYARGEYIGFVDSDDYVDIDMYERMCKKADDTGAQVVVCPLSHEYSNRTRKTFYNEIVFGKSVRQSPKLLAYANSFAHNKIYQRAFWNEHRFEFPLRQWFEDSHLIYNVMLLANKVELVNFPFMHYVRDREESITNRFDMRLFDIFKSANSIITFYKEQGAFEELREELEYICLRHVLARLPNMRRCPDHAESRRFVREMVALLDGAFPDWRNNRYVAKRPKSLHGRLSSMVYRSEFLMNVYVSVPNWMISCLRGGLQGLRKAKKLAVHLIPGRKKRQERKAEESKNLKRRFIQKNGMAVLNEVQTILSDMGIVSFADFGTCLGLVREGQLLAHDLDMDVGVIATPEQREQIRIALEQRGYKLWRQYRYQENPVEESYHYRRVKIDLNFYEMTKDYARTWLFYSKPGHVYENSWTRHVVQMTYSPINGVKYEEFGGYRIALPEDPELLMVEKYGPSWRIPDTGWIYWQSPAAEMLEEVGYFKTVKYDSSVYVDKEAEYAEQNQERLAFIRELQESKLTVLSAVRQACETLNLRYYLGEGTLLGAVRHGGMIPWDQNINLWMPRSDCEKLLREGQQVLGEDFVIQHGCVNPNYFVPYIKIRHRDNSFFCDKKLSRKTEDNGPCIEIYPLDSVPAKDPKLLKKQVGRYRFFKAALYMKHHSRRVKTKKDKLIKLYAKLYSAETLYRRFMETATMYNAEGNEYYICLESKHGVNKQIFEKALFENTQYIRFEGSEYPVPDQAESILQTIYNNYLQPTPAFKRTLKSDYICLRHLPGSENTQPTAYEKWLLENRELQESKLAVLSAVREACKELELRYWLGEGTLLGAFRQGKMIPWDQNINLWMLRSDCERFLKEAGAALGEEYVIQHGSVSPDYFVPYIKVRHRDNSVFHDKTLVEKTENNGPCIEIYPLDSVPAQDPKALERQKKRYSFFKAALYFKHNSRRVKTKKDRLIKLYSKLYSAETLYRRFIESATLYNAPENGYYICLESKHGIQKQIFEKALFENTCYLAFEGSEHPVPDQTETVLRKIYQDDLQPTPAYKQSMKSNFVRTCAQDNSEELDATAEEEETAEEI